MATQPLMKEGLSGPAIDRIATAFHQVDSTFPVKKFKKLAHSGLEALELKARVHHIIAALHAVLPKPLEESAPLFFAVKQHWDYGDSNDSLKGFAAWPIIDYIASHGLNHPELALPLLKHLTPLFSAEFALRPFLTHHPKISYTTLQQWLSDDDPHVRRLVSEGSRPRLPWGTQLPQYIENPAPVLALLESLKDDPSDYVRRSVANSLNDISKNHPDLVIQTCQRWQKKASPERLWIIRHATRTLIKAGHPGSFALLGHTANPQLLPPQLQLDKKQLAVGESLSFNVTLHSSVQQPQSIVLDYAIHYVKANGQSSPKTFKLKSFTLAPGERLTISHTRSFKEITTRRYYPGDHTLELLINGSSAGKKQFLLTAPAT